MKKATAINVPHPFPYQGSKRGIAEYILRYFPSNVQCLLEPFCGSAAVSIAAAAYGFAQQFVLNDLNKPLVDLWLEILEHPTVLCAEYERQWLEQQPETKAYFFQVRNQFNQTHEPHHLLYLLSRIVKGSVRYSSDGRFNQSADNRRLGMKPSTMRQNICGVAALLNKRTILSAIDFRAIVKNAQENDLVYMDPPYQGTSLTKDRRYINGLTYDAFVEALFFMNEKNISYLVSYDGMTGAKVHGKLLPVSLGLKHLSIRAGRSTQATLLGKNSETMESLYLSPSLLHRLEREQPITSKIYKEKQEEIVFA